MKKFDEVWSTRMKSTTFWADLTVFWFGSYFECLILCVTRKRSYALTCCNSGQLCLVERTHWLVLSAINHSSARRPLWNTWNTITRTPPCRQWTVSIRIFSRQLFKSFLRLLTPFSEYLFLFLKYLPSSFHLPAFLLPVSFFLYPAFILSLLFPFIFILSSPFLYSSFSSQASEVSFSLPEFSSSFFLSPLNSLHPHFSSLLLFHLLFPLCSAFPLRDLIFLHTFSISLFFLSFYSSLFTSYFWFSLILFPIFPSSSPSPFSSSYISSYISLYFLRFYTVSWWFAVLTEKCSCW